MRCPKFEKLLHVDFIIHFQLYRGVKYKVMLFVKVWDHVILDYNPKICLSWHEPLIFELFDNSFNRYQKD